MTDEKWVDDDWYEEIEYEVEVVDPSMYILGMDPGGTTGIAMLRIDTEDEKAKPELIYLHQIADGRYGFKDFFEGSTIGGNLIVVSEKWRERNVKGANREPQYIEGGIHMLWGEENVEWQYPDVKDVITDEYLKSQNLWTPDKPHQMDALRHALAYLRNSGHEGTLDTMNPDGSGETIAEPGEAEASQLGDGTPGEDEGTPTDGEAQGEASEAGEGEGTPGPGKGMTFDQMREAIEAAREAMEEFAEVAQELGEGGGPGDGFHLPGLGDPEDDGAHRGRRERNGAFAGFNPVGYDEGGTTLLDE
jgi:hypothetical protein